MKEDYEKTWRDLLCEEMEFCGESTNDTIALVASDKSLSALDGRARKHDWVDFVAYTKERLYVPLVTDGGWAHSTLCSVRSFSRNPPEKT